MVKIVGGLTLTFQGGKKTIVKGTGVAGNVNTTLTVPTGKRWLLSNLRVTLTTDATIADRLVTLTTQDTADAEIFSNVAYKTTASSTEKKYFIFGLTTTGAARNAIGYNLLTAGEDAVISITGGVVGDSYDYLLEYLEIDA